MHGEENIADYVDAVLKEMAVYREMKNEYVVDSIFIGGGTPSSIDEKHVLRILEQLRRNFDLLPDAEITIEVNPGTVCERKLSAYRRSGINRLSIGVQSFSNQILKGLGRIHTAEEAGEAFRMARAAGFDNISIDLMSAVPGLTMELWQDTLEQAADLDPEHISFYSLQIEEGTDFWEWHEKGILKETDVETDRDMYHYAIEWLKEKGYSQYEISNAAKPGRFSRHNMKYWSMEEYLGLGLGASSYLRPYQGLDGRPLLGAGMSFRAANTSSLEEYVLRSGKRKFSGDGAILLADCNASFHENTFFDDASEFVFTGLRRTSGIALSDFFDFTGRHFFDVFGGETEKKIARWEQEGLCCFTRTGKTYGDERDFRFCLTTEGFDVSNKIFVEFV